MGYRVKAGVRVTVSCPVHGVKGRGCVSSGIPSDRRAGKFRAEVAQRYPLGSFALPCEEYLKNTILLLKFVNKTRKRSPYPYPFPNPCPNPYSYPHPLPLRVTLTLAHTLTHTPPLLHFSPYPYVIPYPMPNPHPYSVTILHNPRFSTADAARIGRPPHGTSPLPRVQGIPQM